MNQLYSKIVRKPCNSSNILTNTCFRSHLAKSETIFNKLHIVYIYVHFVVIFVAVKLKAIRNFDTPSNKSVGDMGSLNQFE